MAAEKAVWLEDELNNAKSGKEREEILKRYQAQKLAEAERKEQIRLDSPSMIDKFIDGISTLKKKMFKKRENDKTISQNQQHTR